MPTVPRADRQIETQALPGVKLPSVPEGAFGGMEKTFDAAIGMERARQESIQAEAQEARKRLNSAIGIETDLKLSTLRSGLEYKRGQLKGKDAVGAFDVIKPEWEKSVQDIEGTLTSDEQRLAFSGRVAQHWGTLYGGTLKYADAELSQWENDNRDAFEGLTVEELISVSGDEAASNAKWTTLEAELKDRYKDPLIVEEKLRDFRKTVRKEDEHRRIEAEKAAKEKSLANIDAANKDLTDLQIDGRLSYSEIRKRKDVLTDENYRLWVDRQKAELKDKEQRVKEAQKEKEDKSVETALSVEAMIMPLDADSDTIYSFKQKVAEAVSKGQLSPGAGRSIVSDAENATKIDPMRKAAEDAVVAALKNDYKQGLFGEGQAADLEFIRQIESFKRWRRVNKDKEPSEYYEGISRPVKEGFVKKLLNRAMPVGKEILKQSLPGKIVGTKGGERTIVRTGTHDGRKVIQYSDGSVEYAD